jgi:hypothetical protein
MREGVFWIVAEVNIIGQRFFAAGVSCGIKQSGKSEN